MSAILIPSRRGVIAGLASLFAAPAIVSASSLMPIRALERALILPHGNSLLTIDMVRSEAIQMFTNSNAFLQSLGEQYDDEFSKENAKIGTTLRIRYPRDFVVRETVRLAPPVMHDLTPQEMAVATVAAVAHANPELSRRSLFGLRAA